MTRPDATARILEEARFPPRVRPGDEFCYSNSGYVVLAPVTWSRRPRDGLFADYVMATLLRPAGMTRSGFFGPAPARGSGDGVHAPGPGWLGLLAGAPLADGHLKQRFRPSR